MYCKEELRVNCEKAAVCLLCIAKFRRTEVMLLPEVLKLIAKTLYLSKYEECWRMTI